MKLNKSKNKGKVHPSPSSSSSTSNNKNNDPISSLNQFLPSTILTLISLLSLQDREVLAYMITHSLNSSSSSSSLCFHPKTKKKPYKKTPTNPHISPTFDCCCFACFSSYWNRWNSSPNIKLIDQAIEAFEEHLSKTEINNNIKREKTSVEERERHYCLSMSLPGEEVVGIVEEREDERGLVFATEEMGCGDVEERESEEFPVAGKEEERESGAHQQQQQQHKGLARKVLPDFIGFFQSRLWNRLWGPNV